MRYVKHVYPYIFAGDRCRRPSPSSMFDTPAVDAHACRFGALLLAGKLENSTPTATTDEHNGTVTGLSRDYFL